MIVGLDLGYGYVKVTADGRNTYTFPSVVGTGRRRELTGLFGGGRGMDEMAVEIDGRVYYVGDLATAESYDASRPLSRDKARHDATRILVAAAMLLLPPWSDEEGVRLYTGLPLEYVREQREELSAVLRSMRLDVRGVTGPFAGVIRRVQFRDVKVFPQAIGAMYAALIDERGRPRYPELSGVEDPIALVDVGYRTTDFAVIQVHPRLRVLEELSGTIAVGAHTLYNLVRARYAEIPERDVEQAVRRGEIWIGGRLLDLRREVAESKAAVARTIVDELQHRWSERVRRFRTVFLAGGGAQLFEHGLRGLHPDVRMIEHAQAANAAGFLDHGEHARYDGGASVMAVRGAPKLYGDVRVEDNLALVDMIVQYLDDRARLLAAVNELKKERDRIRAAIKSGGDVRLSDRLSDIERDLSIKQSMLSSLSLAIVGMWSYVRRRIEGAGGHLPPRLRHIKAAIERYRDELREVQNEVSEELRREMVKAHGRKHRWDPAWLETVATSSSVEDEALERIEGTMEPELIIDLRLTGRQEEILRLFSQGYTYTQIAEMLGLAKGSVSVHLRKIRQKAAKADGVQMRFDLDWTGR